jgi:hypothetical protein
MDQSQHKLLLEYIKISDIRDANSAAMDLMKRNQDALEVILVGLHCMITQDTWCEFQHDREFYI